MDLNTDFDARVTLHTERMKWVQSPMPGVDRRMLDRIGGEVARATSIVRYAAGSRFSQHTHAGGEEFIVLDGVFQDEHGDYPAGTYVRNPPTTAHTPGSATGCTIFVKLWQFDPDDRTQFSMTMADHLGQPVDGAAVPLLHSDARETVTYHALDPEAELRLSRSGGTEMLVIDGDVSESGETLGRGAWLRLPDGEPLSVTAGSQGAKLWIKTGHLPYAVAPAV